MTVNTTKHQIDMVFNQRLQYFQNIEKNETQNSKIINPRILETYITINITNIKSKVNHIYKSNQKILIPLFSYRPVCVQVKELCLKCFQLT